MSDNIQQSNQQPSRALLGKAEQEAIRLAFDHLNVALEATKLALELATSASECAHIGEPTGEQAIESWRAHSLVLSEVVDNLYYTGRHTMNSVKQAVGLD